MKIDLIELYKTDPVKACKLALSRTAGVDFKNRMEEVNKLLGAFGVEAIRGEWQNGYWCDIVATYANMGDTYATTVLHVRGGGCWDERGRFVISSWGDWVERNGEKLGVV